MTQASRVGIDDTWLTYDRSATEGTVTAEIVMPGLTATCYGATSAILIQIIDRLR